jgi:hypothetical protein
MTTEMDEDTRLKLLGLKAIAIDLNKQMKTVQGVVGRLTGVTGDAMGDWPSDFCYDDRITVEDLWERTAKYREDAA